MPSSEVGRSSGDGPDPAGLGRPCRRRCGRRRRSSSWTTLASLSAESRLRECERHLFRQHCDVYMHTSQAHAKRPRSVNARATRDVDRTSHILGPDDTEHVRATPADGHGAGAHARSRSRLAPQGERTPRTLSQHTRITRSLFHSLPSDKLNSVRRRTRPLVAVRPQRFSTRD